MRRTTDIQWKLIPNIRYSLRETMFKNIASNNLNPMNLANNIDVTRDSSGDRFIYQCTHMEDCPKCMECNFLHIYIVCRGQYLQKNTVWVLSKTEKNLTPEIFCMGSKENVSLKIISGYWVAWPNVTWRKILSGLGSTIFRHFSRK